jgi:hypothetical protein
MKTYTNVEEWLKSNPSKEVIERVLNTINRGVLTEIRKEYHKKNGELRKMSKVVSNMGDIGLPITKEIKDAAANLSKEVEELKKQLPQPKK